MRRLDHRSWARGGERGGEIVATGAPEEIAKCEDSHTGRSLQVFLQLK